MSIAVESVYSTRGKTREQVRAPSLIPEMLRENSDTLVQLLKDYYSYMNEYGAPSYEVAKITDARDIDVADYPFLDKIQKALVKIDDGTFGTCEECGEEISIKRLEARPETTLCIRCKEDQERNEKSFG